MCFGTSFDILAAASKRPVETARAKAKVWKEAEKVKQVGEPVPADFYRAGWDFTVPAGIFTVPAGSSPAEIGLAPLLLHTAGGCTIVDRRSFRRTTNSRR